MNGEKKMAEQRNRCLCGRPGRWLGRVLLGVLLGTAARGAGPVGDGLYAEFQTSLGTYWCQLEYEKAPRTVANFVQLAEGSRDWVDFERGGLSRAPYYDGLTFHRVVTGFMNQSGSRNGRGTDGPGYQLRDEFHEQLRHHQAGVLSMANAGPHSNGSQFFITVAPAPYLDGLHSVFGKVVQGYEVVAAINSTAGTTNGPPKVTVMLERVRILRQGAGASAFDPQRVQPALPGVWPVASQLRFVPDGRLWLDYPVGAGRLYHVFYGEDLKRWYSASLTSGPADASSLLGLPQVFFFVVEGVNE